MRHCSKRYGKMKDDLIDFESEEVDLDRFARKSTTSAGQMARTRMKSKRESVPSMVFNGLKRRLSTRVR